MASVGIKYKLKKITDKLFLVEFKTEYDLAMTFCRYQEFYESPKFRNKFFKLDDFMKWYAKEYGDGSFSYPADYNGFNIPGKVIEKVLREMYVKQYDYKTKYDYVMESIVYHIMSLGGTGTTGFDFYLIGVHTEKEDTSTERHEIAHGLYYINPSYRREANALLKQTPQPVLKAMRERLKARGYSSAVYADETQAYLATGLHASMKIATIKKVRKPFQDLFKLYLNGVRRG